MLIKVDTMMEIKQENDKFLVVDEGITIYEALSQEEAQGYIDWKQRPDAGNLPGDCGGCENE